jgi:predicted transcriptional regulator
MTEVTVKKIRGILILKSLDDSGERITRESLETALGVQDSNDKRRLSDALAQMVRRGELSRYDDGGYRFIFEASPPSTSEEQWGRVFRAVRSAKGAFGDDLISRVTVVRDCKVKAELQKLLKLGYIEELKTDQGVRYIGTPLLYDTPQVPPMPKLAKNVKTTMRRAREAMAELTRLFLLMEIQGTGTWKLIRHQLAILNEEFGKGAKNDRDENQECNEEA